MIIALWTLVALSLLLWSGLLWGLHALITLPAGWTNGLRAWLDALPGAEQLETWWPGWRDVVVLAADIGQHLLGWLGALSSWLTPLLWAVWGLGAVCALVIGAVLHGLCRLSARDTARAQARA